MSLSISSTSIPPQHETQISTPSLHQTKETDSPKKIVEENIEGAIQKCLNELIEQVATQEEMRKKEISVKPQENSLQQNTSHQKPPLLTQACFAAPRRAVWVSVATREIIQPTAEKSRYFVITPEPVGNLPIGAWKARKVNPGETGTEWNALPFPTSLINNVKELEKLLIKEETTTLSEEELAQKYELEALIQ